MIGYKLMRKRKDGTLGPLFINKKQKIYLNEWMEAGTYPTKGFAVRGGWHILEVPIAPHLKSNIDRRIWVQVEYEGAETFYRPESQGGKWFLAKKMKVVREYIA